MRPRRILAAAAAILLLAAGVGLFLYTRAQSDRKDAADDVMAQATRVFDELDADFRTVDELWLRIEDPAEEDFAGAVAGFEGTATPVLEGSRADLEDLDDAVGNLSESAFKEALSEAVEEMKRALDSLESMISAAGDASPFLTAVDGATAKLDEASGLLNDAIDKNNADDYDGAAADAAKAKQLYEQGLTDLEAAGASFPEGETNKLVEIVKKNIERADVTAKAIEFARDGEIDDYDEMVARFVELNGEIDAAPLPAWIDDATLLIEDMQAAYKAFGEQADAGGKSLSLAEEHYEAGRY